MCNVTQMKMLTVRERLMAVGKRRRWSPEQMGLMLAWFGSQLPVGEVGLEMRCAGFEKGSEANLHAIASQPIENLREVVERSVTAQLERARWN